MGSDSLILDESLAPQVGVRVGDLAVQVVEDEDETGQRYRRSFTHIRGTIHPTEAPEISQTNTEVMFQKIIYDGLVGDSFLRSFVVTFDVWNSRMVFARS